MRSKPPAAPPRKVGDVWTADPIEPSGYRVPRGLSPALTWRQALFLMLQGVTYAGAFGMIAWITPTVPGVLGSHALTSTSPSNPYSRLPPTLIEQRRELQDAFEVRFRATYSAGTQADYAEARAGTHGEYLRQPYCVIRVPRPDRYDVCSNSAAATAIGKAMCVDPLWGLDLAKTQTLSDEAESLFTLHHEEMHCLHGALDKRAVSDFVEPPTRLLLNDELDAIATGHINEMGYVARYKLSHAMAHLDSETTSDLYASLKALQAGRPDLVELVANQRWIRAVQLDDAAHMTAPLLDELVALHESGAIEDISQRDFETPFENLSSTQIVTLLIGLRAGGLRYSDQDMAMIGTGMLASMNADGSFRIEGALGATMPLPSLGKRYSEAIQSLDNGGRVFKRAFSADGTFELETLGDDDVDHERQSGHERLDPLSGSAEGPNL